MGLLGLVKRGPTTRLPPAQPTPGEAAADGSSRKATPRLSWPGVLLSQAMCAFSIWADARWGFDLWWSTVMMAAATGYAVRYLHPPYRRPLLRLLEMYVVWFVGGWAGRWLPW